MSIVKKALANPAQARWYVRKSVFGELRRTRRLAKNGRFEALAGYLREKYTGENPYVNRRISNADGRFVECLVLGNEMVVDPTDAGIGRKLIQHGIHEPVSTERYRTKLSQTSAQDGATVVLDIGANIGYYTLLAARAIGDRGTVHAIEPDPSNLELLRRNVEKNGFEDTVCIHRGAIGDTNGLANLVRDERSNRHRIATHDENFGTDSDVVETRIWTVDTFVERAGLNPAAVDAVRFDVEGYESRIFSGMSAVLDADSSVLVHVELHPGEANDRTEIDEILDLLKRQNFRIVSASADEIAADVESFAELKSLPIHWYELLVEQQ